MSKIYVSPVLLKSGILSVSEVTSHIMLLLWLQILWLGVDLTTVIPCLGVSQLLIFVSCNVFKIVTNTTQYSHITPVRKILHWLPIEHCSIFKTALLVYKFLHCGHPKYFAPFLKPRQSVYNTCRSQADGVFHAVPHFATSIYKYSKHFGLSFAYDTPKIWNALPDDVHSATSLHSFRRKLKTYLFAQAYPP